MHCAPQNSAAPDDGMLDRVEGVGGSTQPALGTPGWGEDLHLNTQSQQVWKGVVVAEMGVSGWWRMPIVPPLWVAEAGRSQIGAQPGQLSGLVRPYLRIKKSKKDWAWS